MTESVRTALAVAAAGLASFALAMGVLLVARLLRPNAPLVQRDLLPGPWRRATAWARSRSLRVWARDPAIGALLAEHLRGSTGAALVASGASMAVGPEVADVVVGRVGDESSEHDSEALSPPWTSLGLVDPSDADEFRGAIDEIAVRLAVVPSRPRTDS